MATPTVISGPRPQHKTARGGDNAIDGAMALDWANGQAVSVGGGSLQSAAFDTKFDRLVMVSTDGNCWIAVGANPTASAGAGSMYVSASAQPFPVYVPAGDLVAVIQDGAATGKCSLIPALLSGS